MIQIETPEKDVTPASPVDAGTESTQGAPVPPDQPGTEEGQPQDVSPQPDENDAAPDAGEPGDDVAPEELEQYSQDQPDQQDNVDQEG